MEGKNCSNTPNQNPLLDDKSLALFKLKVNIDDNSDVTQIINITSISLFPTMFSKGNFLRDFESRHCVVKVKYATEISYVDKT